MAHFWELVGLATNTAGVLLLFRFGMPFRVERKGARYLALERPDSEDVRAERIYKALGYVGITMIVVGALMQAKGLIDV